MNKRILLILIISSQLFLAGCSMMRVRMLIGASTHGTPTEVKLALKLGADPNLRVQTELTPLMFAAGYTSNPEVINALVEYGADPKMKNDSGWQAIDLAEENECIREQRSIIN